MVDQVLGDKLVLKAVAHQRVFCKETEEGKAQADGKEHDPEPGVFLVNQVAQYGASSEQSLSEILLAGIKNDRHWTVVQQVNIHHSAEFAGGYRARKLRLERCHEIFIQRYRYGRRR